MIAPSSQAALQRLSDLMATADSFGVEERAAKYPTHPGRKPAKVRGVKKFVSTVDMNTLDGKRAPGKVRPPCQKALSPHKHDRVVPTVAAVIDAYGNVAVKGRYRAGWLTNERCRSDATSLPNDGVRRIEKEDARIDWAPWSFSAAAEVD